MQLSPDHLLLWQAGFVKLNATLLLTWLIMLLLTLGAHLLLRPLSRPGARSRWLGALEVVVLFLRRQIEEVGLKPADRYLPLLATLFLFIASANLLTIFPFYEPPTGSLSTTAALALCVFVAVPWYGIAESGLGPYLRSFCRPTPLMLPFNLVGELTRTLALAVRLFGNMMSGSMILAILLVVAPLLFPVVMSLLGLLTGLVQAYIFTILATVYIAAATRAREEEGP